MCNLPCICIKDIDRNTCVNLDLCHIKANIRHSPEHSVTLLFFFPIQVIHTNSVKWKLHQNVSPPPRVANSQVIGVIMMFLYPVTQYVNMVSTAFDFWCPLCNTTRKKRSFPKLGYPFPTYNKSAAVDFEIISAKMWKFL